MLNRVPSFCLIGLSFLLLQCDDDGLVNPHYPDEPSIALKEIKFIETPSAGDNDTLKFTIRYKDGDSDLGLDPTDEKDYEYPYNQIFYFLENGLGDTTKVSTRIVYTESDGFILLVTNSTSGKLVTNKTKLNANYNYLPDYDPSSCLNYVLTRLLVPEVSNAIDNSYSILDTIPDENSNRYFLVKEPFLYQLNENHYNISVDYFVLNNDTWIKYDWFGNFCIDYNGRFPVIGKGTGTFNSGPFKIKAKTPWEGEITYKMHSPFLAIFSAKTLKLRITIKDRALHTSNVVETTPFTLEEIK